MPKSNCYDCKYRRSVPGDCHGEGECKYCKNPSKYLAICQNYETRIFVGISGEYLQIFDEDYLGFCDNHKINFCPICGRKLG